MPRTFATPYEKICEKSSNLFQYFTFPGHGSDGYSINFTKHLHFFSHLPYLQNSLANFNIHATIVKLPEIAVLLPVEAMPA